MCQQYFSHDYNARQDIKVRRLQFDLGMWGIGVFWSLVEELYASGNHIPLTDMAMIARSLGSTTKKVMRVVECYGLFGVAEDENGQYIYSESVAKRLAYRYDKAKEKDNKTDEGLTSDDSKTSLSEARRKAAKARWNKTPKPLKIAGSDANGMQNAMQNDANAYAKSDANGMQMHEVAYANTDAKLCKTPPIYINRNININRNTTTTSTTMQTREEGDAKADAKNDEQNSLATTSDTSRTSKAIYDEIFGLMANENVRFQIYSKSGGVDTSTALTYLPEFAGQLELQGNTETGYKLVMHFAYWLAKKKTELEKQARNGDYKQREEQRFRETQRALIGDMVYGDSNPMREDRAQPTIKSDFDVCGMYDDSKSASLPKDVEDVCGVFEV